MDSSHSWFNRKSGRIIRFELDFTLQRISLTLLCFGSIKLRVRRFTIAAEDVRLAIRDIYQISVREKEQGSLSC